VRCQCEGIFNTLPLLIVSVRKREEGTRRKREKEEKNIGKRIKKKNNKKMMITWKRKPLIRYKSSYPSKFVIFWEISMGFDLLLMKKKEKKQFPMLQVQEWPRDYAVL